MKPNEVSELAGGFAGSMIVAALIVLGVLALLLPVFVLQLLAELKRLRQVAEQQLAESQALRGLLRAQTRGEVEKFTRPEGY